MKGIWGNKIIVLIVLIGTLYLNEAMSFSLFNATQIVSIRFEKPGENSGNYLAVTKILQNFLEKALTNAFFCSIILTTSKNALNRIGIQSVGEHLDDTLE